MSFARRLIEVTFQLGEGAFGESGTNTVTLAGLRMTSKIVKAGGRSMGTASIRINGMTLSLMNQLSTLGQLVQLTRRNTIAIAAGDEGSTLGTVFVGTITNAWIDFQGAPDVAFQVEAHAGLIEALAPCPPSSFKGSADVAVILSGLATQMGLPFENNGVSVILSNPVFNGSARDQALAAVEHAGIEWNGLDNGVLAIWPRGGARGSTAPLISPETGMVGYPAYTSKGILVRTLFNPSIGYGQKIVVQSSVQPACGEWNVYSLDHNLDTLQPNGQWFSTLEACRPGLVALK